MHPGTIPGLHGQSGLFVARTVAPTRTKTIKSSTQHAHGRLGRILRDLKADTGLKLSDLTVLASANDPFRLDTPANHKLAIWFRDKIEAVGYSGHLRGFHYVLVSTTALRKPDGKAYKNDFRNWLWLLKAAKAARWLEYVPFYRITDERNDAPIIRPAAQRLQPLSHVGLGITSTIEIPTRLGTRDLRPTAVLSELDSPQDYRLAFFGEKTSLEPVLGPLADEYYADLYLAAGEQTDTRLYHCAHDANEDGRPLVVFVFADCDPSGYQMLVSIAHKLRAFKELLFPDLEFQVHAPALTVMQVGQLGLPSSPLKAEEKRKDKWIQAYGIEQTEIDALATLQPNVLRGIARQAIAPFFDDTLGERIQIAESEWRRQAQRKVNAAAKAKPGYAKLRDKVLADLAKAKKSLTALESGSIKLINGHDLPHFDMPEAEPDDDGPEPLVSTDMELEEHIERLRERKSYTNK